MGAQLQEEPAKRGKKKEKKKKGVRLGALGVNYRHSLRKRRGPKCRRRSFSLLFFLSCFSCAVCVFVFLSLSLFPFIYFPILRLAVGAAALLYRRPGHNGSSRRKRSENNNKNTGRKKRKKKKKKRMTAIKQANSSSSHLSSI